MCSAGPLLHQDLIFDLGDPVRWEYLLLGTDKPHLSLLDEDDEALMDDDDIVSLVSLTALGGRGQGEERGFILGHGSGRADKRPVSMTRPGRPTINSSRAWIMASFYR